MNIPYIRKRNAGPITGRETEYIHCIYIMTRIASTANIHIPTFRFSEDTTYIDVYHLYKSEEVAIRLFL